MDVPGSKVGVLFSGQASPEQRNLVQAVLGSGGATVVVAGALDGLSAAELRAMAPARGEQQIITELEDGENVIVSLATLTARLQGKIDELAACGCTLLMLLSTGAYPGLASPVPALLPSRVLEALVAASVARGSRLGVLVPLAEQVGEIGDLWQSRGYAVTCAAANPWGDPAELDVAAARIAAARPALVVMDCFAYSREHKDRFRRGVDGLVLLPQEVVVPLALQLIG